MAIKNIRNRFDFQHAAAMLFSLLLISTVSPAEALAEEQCDAVAMYGHHAWETQFDQIVDPTCTTEGTVVQICAACPATKVTHIPAYGHSFVPTGNREDPTCQSDGWEEQQCVNCGEYHYMALAPVDHYWIDTGEGVLPTCTDNGYRVYRCMWCGEETSFTEYATGEHSYLAYNVKEGDCQTPGYRYYECAVCGAEYTEELGYGDHEYGDWMITTPSTDHSAGVRTRTCSVCGEQQMESFYPDGTCYRGGPGGAEVASCQTMLIVLGYLNDVADGIFGGNTEAAVVSFQESSGLNPDGILWPQTKSILEAAWNRKQAEDAAENPSERPGKAAAESTSEKPGKDAAENPSEKQVEGAAENPSDRHTAACSWLSKEPGMEYVTMCPEHAPMAETLMYAALRGQTTAAGIRKMSLEWEEALDALYEKQAQGAADRGVWDNARKAFYDMLKLQDQVLSENDASAAALWRLNAIRNEVFRLCACS